MGLATKLIRPISYRTASYYNYTTITAADAANDDDDNDYDGVCSAQCNTKSNVIGNRQSNIVIEIHEYTASQKLGRFLCFDNVNQL